MSSCRLLWFVAAAVALLALAPSPAAADPAEPGPYRSEVTSIDPEVDGVRLEVTGGDSFLELSVDPGVEVVVFGYEDEPYLRVLPDGTVEQNLRSSSAYLNEDRYGGGAVPAEVDPEAEPTWEQVGTGGTYAWHDHRIHWMSPDTPPRLEGGTGLVQEWTVPISVDGLSVEVVGRLDKVPSTSPLPWLALLVVVGVGGWFLGRRNVAVAVPVMTVVGGVVATYVGWREVAAQPASVGASPLPLVLGAVALGAAVAGAVLRSTGRRVAGDVLGLASSAALGGWVLLRFSVLTNPVLPTDLPAPVDRLGTALVLALTLASAVLGVQGGSLAGGQRAGRDEGGDVAPSAAAG